MIKCPWRLNKMYWKRRNELRKVVKMTRSIASITQLHGLDTFWLSNVTKIGDCQQVQSLSYLYAIKSQLKIYPEQKIIQRHLPFPLVAIVLKTCLRNEIVCPCLDQWLFYEFYSFLNYTIALVLMLVAGRSGYFQYFFLPFRDVKELLAWLESTETREQR